MSSSAPPAEPPREAGRNHLKRFLVIWLVASVVAMPLVALLLGPILPPGKGSDAASGQVTDNTVLLTMATPVLLLVLIYLAYALVYFRAGADDERWKGPPCADTRGCRRCGS